MGFCTQCGTKLAFDSAFCTRCGATSSPTPATGTIAEEARPVSAERVADSPPRISTPKKSSSGFGKVLTWVGIVILLVGGASVAGIVYVGHRVKDKVGEFTKPRDSSDSKERAQNEAGQSPEKSGGPQKNSEEDQVAKALDGIGGLMDKMGFGDRPADPYQNLPTITPAQASKVACPPAGQAAHPFGLTTSATSDKKIPFREKLAITAAWGRKFGDVESTSTISSVRQDSIEIANSGTYFKSDDDQVGALDSARRDVCWQDLQGAHGYITEYKRSYPLIARETTSSFLSAAAFNELKSQGKTTLRYLLFYPADDEGYRLHWQEAVLTRAEPDDVQYPVIVNDEPTTVPAIHAKGTMLTMDSKARELSKVPLDQPLPTELLVLDDPDDPIVLLYRMDIGAFRVQVIRLSFPQEKTDNKIEEGLAKNKKVLVYGIYFDYNSDQIKKESEPVLKEIAQAMKNNPDWKLIVDGHTDSIGGDAYNLDLSKRRAAAVKQALVDRFRIAGDRLLTEGFGMRRPVDRNDTLEGRARNRRVELSRE